MRPNSPTKCWQTNVAHRGLYNNHHRRRASNKIYWNLLLTFPFTVASLFLCPTVLLSVLHVFLCVKTKSYELLPINCHSHLSNQTQSFQWWYDSSFNITDIYIFNKLFGWLLILFPTRKESTRQESKPTTSVDMIKQENMQFQQQHQLNNHDRLSSRNQDHHSKDFLF